MIRITAKREGLRCCGIAHSTQPTDYPDGRWSAEALALLRGEPMLVVEHVASPPPAPSTGEGRGEGEHTPERTRRRRQRASAP